MLLSSDSNSPNISSIISKDEDKEKYLKIKNTLCEKRRAVEEILKDETIPPSVREENALLLIEKKHNLEVFGISEIDYQAYLAQQSQAIEETPPSLF